MRRERLISVTVKGMKLSPLMVRKFAWKCDLVPAGSRLVCCVCAPRKGKA